MRINICIQLLKLDGCMIFIINILNKNYLNKDIIHTIYQFLNPNNLKQKKYDFYVIKQPDNIYYVLQPSTYYCGSGFAINSLYQYKKLMIYSPSKSNKWYTNILHFFSPNKV